MSFLQPNKNDDAVGEDLERLEWLCSEEHTYGHKLTDWEFEFLESMRERLEQYGERTFVSPKQWAIIERIEAKIAQESMDF